MSLKSSWVSILVVVFSLGGCTAGKNASSGKNVIQLGPSDQNVVAVIGDEKVMENDFIENMDNAVRGEFSKAQQQYRDAKEGALTQMIFGKLLKKEAAAQKISENEILEKEVSSKIEKVSDADVQKFYDEASKRFTASGRAAPPLDDQIKAQISMSLSGEKRAKRQMAYTEELFSKYNVSLVLPEPIRFNMAKGDLPAQGKEGAKVTIIEFSDYHCPFCKRGSDNMKEVMKKYGSKVEYRYRDYPLEQIHPRAKPAAIAARCANEQGKFWAYHDKIFENQGKKEDADFEQFAKDLGLKMDAYKTCYADPKHAKAVERDILEGRKAGVTGTPAYFINGVFLSGAVPPEKIMAIVESEL